MRVKNKLCWLAIVQLFFISVVTVYAFNQKEAFGTGKYTVDKPISWYQGDEPRNSTRFEFCDEGKLGPCGCGTYSATTILLKTGYWGKGKEVKDGLKFVTDNALVRRCVIASSTSSTCTPSEDSYDTLKASGKLFGPAYSYEKLEGSTNGYIKHVRDHRENLSMSEAAKILKDVEAKGYFALIGVELNGPGSGHEVVFDYMEGDHPVIIDSGGTYKYLEAMHSVLDIQVFKVEELSSKDAPKFWKGDEPYDEGAEDGAKHDSPNADSIGEGSASNSSSSNNSGGNNGGGLPDGMIQGELEDPFAWSDKEIVKYNEHLDKGVEDSNKGVQRKNTSWIDKLFGQ